MMAEFEMTEQRMDKVLTQYRESPKLLFLIKTYLSKLEEMHLQVDGLPTLFDIDFAIGDQLTILGKRLGWPRCHCVCETQPTFGFQCEDGTSNVSGFCDGSVTWESCGDFGVGDICISDDETYRKFLKVRRYQMLYRYDSQSLDESLEILFGENAKVLYSGQRRIVITAGRYLEDPEIALLQLYPRILPVALGIQVRFHFYKGTRQIFGFGEGWGGFCEELNNDLYLTTEEGDYITTEEGDRIISDAILGDALWMCEFDVKPYDC